MFSSYDSHAKKVLLTETMDQNGMIEPEIYDLRYSGAEYSKLKLFFLSVIWRGSHSKNQMFERVALGKHEPIFREMIKNGDAGTTGKYAVFMQRLCNVPMKGLTFFNPTKGRFEELNSYILYLNDYKIWIIADRRELPKKLWPIALSKACAPVKLENYANSEERKIWHKLASKELARQKTYKK